MERKVIKLKVSKILKALRVSDIVNKSQIIERIDCGSLYLSFEDDDKTEYNINTTKPNDIIGKILVKDIEQLSELIICSENEVETGIRLLLDGENEVEIELLEGYGYEDLPFEDLIIKPQGFLLNDNNKYGIYLTKFVINMKR